MPRSRGGIDAQRLTPNFERERDPFHAKQLRDQGTTEAERRAAFKVKRRDPSGSRMVKRQRPAPTHKPSPQLARGPDRNAYNDQMARDHREAQRNSKIARGEAMRRELNQHALWLDRKAEQVARMPAPSTREGRTASEKELFRAKRQMGDSSKRLLNRAHSVRRDLNDR
ncbi:MAG: hypothetical protein AAF590_11175 [Pseudomonadota bacterium]